MMHLQFPRSREFYTWVELSCLSRSLGFPSETIKNCVPDEITSLTDGISFKDLLKLIELKYFNDALDRSINMHTADYNINTLLQFFKLLNHRLLTFSELNNVRVAFQVYEAGDMRGMVIDPHIQMRTLKLCDRTIAPMKLMHRLKHMQEGFDEPGRIQLYEFLDLIVLCELTREINVPDFKHGPLDKTWRRLFEIDNFQTVCTTTDEKLEHHLNKHFKNTELNYGREVLSSKKMSREAAIDTTKRKQIVHHHNRKYRELQSFVGSSTAQVQRTKAGHNGARSAVTTAPEIDQFRLAPDSPLHSVLRRPHTVADLTTRLVVTPPPSHRPHSTPHPASASTLRSQKFRGQSELSAHEDPRIKLLRALHDGRTLRSESTPPNHQGPTPAADGHQEPWKRRPGSAYPRPDMPKVVDEGDVTEQKHILEGLQYQMETLEERALQKLEQQMMTYLPQFYRQKQEAGEGVSRTRTTTPAVSHPKKKTKKKKGQSAKGPTPESIDRLIHPKVRLYHDVHDRNCDARSQECPARKAGGAHRRRPPPRDGSMEDAAGGRGGVLLLRSQLLLADGRRVSCTSEKNLETMSSFSSLAGSSLAAAPKTTDFTTTSGQIQPWASPKRDHDPARFEASRVGAAAVLHDYLLHRRRDEAGTSGGVPSAPAAEDAKPAERNTKIVPRTGRHAWPSRTAIADPWLPGWTELTRVKRNTVTAAGQEEEELKINGVSLSEIDRLTFKEEHE